MGAMGSGLGVISCLLNMGQIVYESGLVVSESGFEFPNQGFLGFDSRFAVSESGLQFGF